MTDSSRTRASQSFWKNICHRLGGGPIGAEPFQVQIDNSWLRDRTWKGSAPIGSYKSLAFLLLFPWLFLKIPTTFANNPLHLRPK